MLPVPCTTLLLLLLSYLTFLPCFSLHFHQPLLENSWVLRCLSWRSICRRLSAVSCQNLLHSAVLLLQHLCLRSIYDSLGIRRSCICRWIGR